MRGDSAIPELQLSIPKGQCRIPVHPRIVKGLGYDRTFRAFCQERALGNEVGVG